VADNRIRARNLFVGASNQYDDRVKVRLHVATAMRRSCRPTGNGQILVHHLLTGEHRAISGATCQHLRASGAWAFLRNRKTYSQLWRAITTSSDVMPHFVSTVEVGFSRTIGLGVYTPDDLAPETRG